MKCRCCKKPLQDDDYCYDKDCHCFGINQHREGFAFDGLPFVLKEGE